MLCLSVVCGLLSPPIDRMRRKKEVIDGHGSRATLDALENGRAGELGFSKVAKLLAALGLELTLQTAGSQRPTLDELMQEDRDDKGLDRRR